jgi:hypothetical protein
MFLFKLLPGSLTRYAQTVEHRVADFAGPHEFPSDPIDGNSKNGLIDKIADLTGYDHHVNETAKAEESDSAGCNEPSILKHLPQSAQSRKTFPMERKRVPSLAEVVQSAAWTALRTDFDKFCEMLDDDAVSDRPDARDCSEIKTQLQRKLVDKLLPSDEGSEWNALKDELIEEIRSPLKPPYDISPFLVTNPCTPLKKDRVQVQCTDGSPFQYCGRTFDASQSTYLPAQSATSRLQVPYQLDSRTPSRHRLSNITLPSVVIAQGPKSMEHLLCYELDKRPLSASASSSTCTPSIPPDDLSRRDDDFGDEESIFIDNSIMQSSEDEEASPSTAPTSAPISAQTTPEKVIGASTPDFKRTTSSSSKYELGANIESSTNLDKTPRIIQNNTIPEQDEPTLQALESPSSNAKLRFRRCIQIPRRTQTNSSPLVTTENTSAGFKPIFDLRKRTPTREEIAAHIDFSNKIFVGEVSIGLQRNCLQCVVANLPCDKAWPCSRCARHGRGELCLVQRDLGIKEKMIIGIDEHPYVALVRRSIESDEIWEMKKNLEAQLLDVLQEKCDKANWVLPTDRRKTGGFLKRTKWCTRAFEVDNVRGKQWEPDFVVDELMMPISITL